MSSKDYLRDIYRLALGSATLAALPLRTRRRLAVNYGGARPGDVGGTLTKVRLLQSRFPEHFVGFSLLYILSNAIYLPQPVIDRARKSGVPLVLNQNGVFYPGWYGAGWAEQNARMAAVHAVADHVFYQSEFCRRCAEKFLGPRQGASEILFNGVDTEKFSPAGRPSSRPFTFLVTGKIGQWTSYRVTASISGIAAARKSGLDVRLKIAGVIEAAVATAAREQANKLGAKDAVEFTGPYTNADAPGIYRSADAYLMLKYNDPCPNVVLEAMASGLPVLYSASGGVPEQVGADGGIGLPLPENFEADLVPEPADIAEGMARVISAREKMAAAARARAVERFDLSHWLDRHQNIFESLLSRAT